ncbi:MAG: nitroreductase [Bacteroidales bacterium]|nr:nitroreductase [Bacteroidales bacterium]
MDILEAITTRRSVRTFDGTPLTPDVRKQLMDCAASVENPFGGRFTIRLKEFDLKNGFKPATYGVIRGASDFFTIGMADDDTSALAVGFCFEQVVLKATQLGLGTCWIAGTFKGSDFERGESWPEGESRRIVCPVGTPAGKSFMEKFARMALGSKNRKPFGDLFFEGDCGAPLSPDSRFGEALAMLRLAPSSTNSQPWRAVVEDDTVHFYYISKGQVSIVDCGIGLSHFYLTEKYRGRGGEFFKASQLPEVKKNWTYLISYK